MTKEEEFIDVETMKVEMNLPIGMVEWLLEESDGNIEEYIIYMVSTLMLIYVNA